MKLVIRKTIFEGAILPKKEKREKNPLYALRGVLPKRKSESKG